MKSYFFLPLCSVFCSVLLCGGCQMKQTMQEQSIAKEAQIMINIRKVTRSEKTLAVDYEVQNLFEDDIRVCQDINIYSNMDVAIRIDEEDIWLKLHTDLEADNVFWSPEPVAKYIRLRPGESHSGRILLSLPIKNFSPVKWPQVSQKRKEIFLQRANLILEVGYFAPRSNERFEEISKMSQEMGVGGFIEIEGRGWPSLQSSPFTTEEIQNGQAHEVTYISAPWLAMPGEEIARVSVSAVCLPCLVPDDSGE